MKKIFLAIACIALILSTVACEQNDTTQQTPVVSDASDKSENTEASRDDNFSGEIRVYSMSPDRSGFWDQMAQNYKDKNPDVDVIFEVYEAGQYYSALSTALQANDMPELFTSHGSKNANLLQYINADVVLDLDPHISEDDLKVFDEFLIQRAKVGGKLYMTPGSFLDTWPIFYNKDIFEELDLSIPNTFDEFVDVMDTLNENGYVALGMPGKDVKGPAHIITTIHGMMYPEWCLDFVNFRFDEGGKYSDPRYIEGLQVFLDWIDKGYFGDDWKGLDTNGGILEFTSGKSAMWPRGSYDKDAISANSEINIGVFNPPTKDGGRVLISGQDAASGFSVYSKANDLDLSLDVLKHLFSAESMQIIADAGFNIPGRTDISSTDPIFAQLDENPVSVVLPLYVDYNGALGYEGLDTWVEFKNVSTSLAYGEITPEQFVEKFEDEVISYEIRNFDPWGDGR